MQRYGVLFVQDPVVAMDLAEILSIKLGPIQLHFPTTATEAAALLQDAVCVVTDRMSCARLSQTVAVVSIPQLHLGAEKDNPLSSVFARIEEPFTNGSVADALNALGLIT